MKTVFYKYHGTGNDFIIIDDRESFFNLPEEVISQMCNRRFGIGADGLILLQNDEKYDFRMLYFNSDGSESTMCGNGGRCITAFANHLRIISNKATFVAIDGIHESIIHNIDESGEADVKLKMKDIQDIMIVGDNFFINSGSPHYIVFVNDLQKYDVVENGRKLRYQKDFEPGGTNVNFIEELNGRIYIRTYERGVEDETLSCGTGTTACAIAIAAVKKIKKGSIALIAPGGQLNVSFTKNDTTFENIWLEGPAKFVYKGEINL